MRLEMGHRRATFLEISGTATPATPPLSKEELSAFTDFDLIYRSLCALMFNYVPTSGHPGGSVSSGRFVACTLFDSMDYDLSKPERSDADMISYAAGHKAMGLYAMWALRNEIARFGCPDMLPSKQNHQLRLEDLLGFRVRPAESLDGFARAHIRGSLEQRLILEVDPAVLLHTRPVGEEAGNHQRNEQ